MSCRGGDWAEGKREGGREGGREEREGEGAGEARRRGLARTVAAGEGVGSGEGIRGPPPGSAATPCPDRLPRIGPRAFKLS